MDPYIYIMIFWIMSLFSKTYRDFPLIGKTIQRSNPSDVQSLGKALVTAWTRTNSAGDSHCYHCGKIGHWANKCPQLMNEQLTQLQIVMDRGNKGKEQNAHTVHQFMQHLVMAQGDGLPDSWAYLNGCSTVTTIKIKKHLQNIKMMKCGVKINCNVGTVKTNQ
jgi:hypothetical protein